MARIVVALGGNALGITPAEQVENVKKAAMSIVDIIEAGHEVIVTHGNGPQVGMINLAFAAASQADVIKADMPFPECGAMSQGYIGYHLQNSLINELSSRGLNKPVTTVVTQVLVSEDDPAFLHPTKPVGAFYSEKEADEIASTSGYTMMEDAGRGWRRVVASPKPIDVIEKRAIATLLQSGCIVIAGGGGGIPVIQKGGKLVGITAVIDKDFASAKLAYLVNADILIILTEVDKVYINWGKPDMQALDTITVDEAEIYVSEGHFAPGSMLPKVEAAISFAESGPGRRAIITSLSKASEALIPGTGTVILPSLKSS
ncbi:MAG: carbamate kinase [Clostridiales bacterium]|jgi:carbamate kinase|nr:carbamate kinase [Clostridiales bacterium]